MHRTISLSVALSLAFAVGACDKKKESGAPEGAKSTERAGREPAKPAAKPVSAELFGKKVAPPGALGKLSIGMPAADAVKAAPDLFPKGTEDDYQSTDAPGWEGVSFAVGLDDDTKTKVDRLTVSMPAAGKDAVIAAWGPGKEAKDSIDRPRLYWFDPETGWRAYLEQGFGDDVNLEFHRYTPFEKFLGDAPDTLAFAPAGLLGATVEDLRARHAAHLVEKDAAQAAKDRADLEKFTGEKLDDKLGAAEPSVHLELPPTEWDAFWTRVNFHWTDDHKVRIVYFQIPYEAYAPAKEEILAFLKKKWGEPKPFKDYGRDKLLFREKAPRVVVEDDTISNAWSIEVSNEE